jgi:cell division protein FtsL
VNRTELPAVPSAPKTKGLGWPAFLLALTMVGALAHVAVRLHVLELAYDLARQRKVQSALEEQRRRLQTEIGMLKDPNRIVALARDRLHMGPPMAEDIRRLRAGMSLRAAPPPEPAGAHPGTGTAGVPGSGNKAPVARPKASVVSRPAGAEPAREAAP